MNEPDEIQVSQWLRNGIAAAKAGRREEARRLLSQVVEINPQSEQAWLWLSGVVDASEDRLICLENVLTLNPDNVQARAGLRRLQEQSVEGGLTAEDAGAPSREPAEMDQSLSAHQLEQGLFLTADGCVYCGLSVADSDARCPHCSRRLAIKRFKKEERSALAFLLHSYWILLAGVSLADFVLIGFVWENIGQLSWFVKKFLPYAVGPVVTGGRTIEAVVDPGAWVQIARIALLTLAVLGGLDALGLFFRRPRAHTLGLGLIAVHLVVGVALFILGFLGYVMVAFRGLLTVMLTVRHILILEDW